MVRYSNIHNCHNYGKYFSFWQCIWRKVQTTNVSVQKWKTFWLLLCVWDPECSVFAGGITRTHRRRLATKQENKHRHIVSKVCPPCEYYELRLSFSIGQEGQLHKVTLVYWNVSCRPVNVASIDWGVVSISQIPGAAHNISQVCSCLFQYHSTFLLS